MICGLLCLHVSLQTRTEKLCFCTTVLTLQYTKLKLLHIVFILFYHFNCNKYNKMSFEE